jgi:flagellar motor switch protein FliG
VTAGERWNNLDGTTKAAIVLLALGRNAAGTVIKNLTESQVEKIATEIASLEPVPPEVQNRVLREFTGAMAAGGGGSMGGVDTASEILESALGKSKASEIVSRLRRLNSTGALGKLQQMDPATVAEFLKGEHPQVIALIVARLDVQFAANTLSALPEDLRGDVAMRIATMDTVSPDTTEEIDDILASQLEGIGRSDSAAAGGVKILANILNVSERSTEQDVLAVMESRDAGVATQVKQLMFVFDDILLLEDRSVQRVLREVDTKDLSVALKAADDEVKQKIFKNISERAATMIQEEIEYMGPKRLSEVEAAQQAIVEVIRNLEASGDIIIPGRGGGGDELIV